jgi:hypothetical protein
MVPVRARTRFRDASVQNPDTPVALSRVPDPALSWAGTLNLRIEYRAVTDLRRHARELRTHSPKQIVQIAAALREFGFINPIIVKRDGEIVAGHGRFAAAKHLELKQVPTIAVEHLTPEQLRAYRIADNRLAELSEWDREILAIEFDELLNLELSFEVEITGFEMAQIDALIDPHAKDSETDPADEVMEPQGQAVTQKGDLWLLGRHRLLCADALDPVSYEALLAGEKAQMVFTDPPFNVIIRNSHEYTSDCLECSSRPYGQCRKPRNVVR